MIRPAAEQDIPAVAAIYSAIHDEEEAGRLTTGWQRSIYPTEATARRALAEGELFVEEEGGAVVGAAIINQKQVDVYRQGRWQHDAPDSEVMVLHTLTISPATAGRGCGKRMVQFYEAYALAHGCPYLRIDTNQTNRPARTLYHKLGYREVGIVPCVFNGIEGVGLVLLEKKL